MDQMTVQSAQPLVATATEPAPWAIARQYLADADFYWLATVHPDGRAHVRPILAVWHEDALYFCANATTRKAKNLAHNASCTLTAAGENAHLVAEGHTSLVHDEATLRRVATAYATKYSWPVSVDKRAFYAEGAPTAGPPPYQVYAVSLTAVYGFGIDESFTSTRWRF